MHFTVSQKGERKVYYEKGAGREAVSGTLERAEIQQERLCSVAFLIILPILGLWSTGQTPEKSPQTLQLSVGTKPTFELPLLAAKN